MSGSSDPVFRIPVRARLRCVRSVVSSSGHVHFLALRCLWLRVSYSFLSESGFVRNFSASQVRRCRPEEKCNSLTVLFVTATRHRARFWRWVGHLRQRRVRWFDRVGLAIVVTCSLLASLVGVSLVEPASALTAGARVRCNMNLYGEPGHWMYSPAYNTTSAAAGASVSLACRMPSGQTVVGSGGTLLNVYNGTIGRSAPIGTTGVPVISASWCAQNLNDQSVCLLQIANDAAAGLFRAEGYMFQAGGNVQLSALAGYGYFDGNYDAASWTFTLQDAVTSTTAVVPVDLAITLVGQGVVGQVYPSAPTEIPAGHAPYPAPNPYSVTLESNRWNNDDHRDRLGHQPHHPPTSRSSRDNASRSCVRRQRMGPCPRWR
jgi:hypothetical protein